MNVRVKGVVNIPVVDIATGPTFCDRETTQLLPLPLTILVSVVTPAPAKYCPIAIIPVTELTVKAVPLIVPVNELFGTPVEMLMGDPTDPAVWLGYTVQVETLPDTM